MNPLVRHVSDSVGICYDNLMNMGLGRQVDH